MSSKGVVLITGAAKRIGRVIAIEAAKAGWDVAIHYNTSRTDAETLVEEIRALGCKTCLAKADLMDGQAVEDLIPRVNNACGPLSALVNNAALFEPDKTDPDGVCHRTINFDVPCRLCEIFAQQLPPEKAGAVVNMLDSTDVPPFFSAYAASKKNLHKATLAMARTLAPWVRTNGVAPGPTWMNPRETREHFDRMVKATPLQVEISPQAVASTVLFLITNPAISGEVIHVDGGQHMVNPTIRTN